MASTQILDGKVALVTGASGGIGSEVAQLFAANGAQVIVHYAGSRAKADAVVQTIESAGGQAYAVQADISRPADVARLFDETIARYGKVNILANTAGINIYKLVKDVTEEDFDRLFDTNVKGTFFALKEAATRLADGGRIINFSTTIARLMVPTYATYTATKTAVEQLTRVFAKEIGSRGITVNSIAPGPTDTPLFREGKTETQMQQFATMAALGRLGSPPDIAQVALFLASDASGWVSGQNIGVNGGLA